MSDTTESVPFDAENLDWLCWVLVSGRNNWWHPDETGRDCIQGLYDDPTDEQIAREQGVHRGRFTTYQQIIEDLGSIISQRDLTDDDFESHGEWIEHCTSLVESRAADEIERSRANGLDLPDEPSMADLRDANMDDVEGED